MKKSIENAFENEEIDLKYRLDEIQKAIDSGLHQAALGLALTIPDICGNIEYADQEDKKNNSEHYKQWFDNHVKNKYIPKAENGKLNLDTRIMNGQICYKLRCAFLHFGDNNIKNSGLLSIESDFDEGYKLSYTFILSTDYESLGSRTDLEELKREYIIYINIINLCKNICESANNFIKEWPNKDDFKEHSFSLYSSKKWNEDIKLFRKV